MPLKREIEALLVRNGFTYLRESRHGQLWTDGVSTVLAGNNLQGRNEKNLEADIRRAIRRRPGFAIDRAPDSVPPKQRFIEQVKGKIMQVKLGDIIVHRENGSKVYAKGIIKPGQAIDQEDLDKQAHQAQQAVSKFAQNSVQANAQVNAQAKAPEAAPREKFRRFTVAQREKLYPRIIALHNAGLKPAKIAHLLNGEGFRFPNGDEIETTLISGIMTAAAHNPKSHAWEIRVRMEKEAQKPLPVETPQPKPVAAPPQPAKGGSALPRAVVSILTDPSLDASRKVRALSAWKSNATLHDVLTDPDLANEEKIAMLLALTDWA